MRSCREPKGRTLLGVLGWMFLEGDLEEKEMGGGPGNTGRKVEKREKGRKPTSLNRLLLCATGTQSAGEFWRQCRDVSGYPTRGASDPPASTSYR